MRTYLSEHTQTSIFMFSYFYDFIQTNVEKHTYADKKNIPHLQHLPQEAVRWLNNCVVVTQVMPL